MSKFCTRCGFENKDYSQFCPRCGEALVDISVINSGSHRNSSKIIDENVIDIDVGADKSYTNDSDIINKDRIKDMSDNRWDNRRDNRSNDRSKDKDKTNDNNIDFIEGIFSDKKENNENKSFKDSNSENSYANENEENLSLRERIELDIKENIVDNIELDLTSKKEEKESQLIESVLNINKSTKNELDNLEDNIKNAVITKRDSLVHKKEDVAKITDQLQQGLLSFGDINSSIILKKDEKVLLDMDKISLKEPNKVRVSNRNNLGASLKVTKRVSMHLGGGQTKSMAHEEIVNVDKGNLIITNKRLCFFGEKKLIEMDLSKIISIIDFKEGISVQGNKNKVEYFEGTNKSNLTFVVDGRKQSTPLYGNIVKAAIIGQINNLE